VSRAALCPTCGGAGRCVVNESFDSGLVHACDGCRCFYFVRQGEISGEQLPPDVRDYSFAKGPVVNDGGVVYGTTTPPAWATRRKGEG
jgi:hypothetical protein